MTLGECFTALGYFTGGSVLVWAARRRGFATEGMATVAAVGFLAAILGAKVTQMLAQGIWTLDPTAGGRSLLGGLLFGWLGVELTKRRLGIRSSTGDLFALALPAGEAVGRIGCYFNGCCFGIPYDGPGAVWQHGAWRHPAQLYSSAVSAALFLVLLAYYLRASASGRSPTDGGLFRIYLIGFGATRFLLEFVRWRESLIFGLSPMQWICLELTAYGLVWTWVRRRRPEVQRG